MKTPPCTSVTQLQVYVILFCDSYRYFLTTSVWKAWMAERDEILDLLREAKVAKSLSPLLLTRLEPCT